MLKTKPFIACLAAIAYTTVMAQDWQLDEINRNYAEEGTYLLDTMELVKTFNEYAEQSGERAVTDRARRLGHEGLLLYRQCQKLAKLDTEHTHGTGEVTPHELGDKWRTLVDECKQLRGRIDPELITWKSGRDYFSKTPAQTIRSRSVQHVQSPSQNVPKQVRDRIVAKLRRDHGRDSNTINYWVPRQIKAYQDFQKFTPSEVAGSDLFRIKNKVVRDHPDDYVTQLHVVRRQAQAYASLRKYVDNRLPRDVFIRVKQAIAKDHPDDYLTQFHVIQNNIGWYVQEDRRKHPNVRPIPELF